jgi:hypothetical protein
MPSFVIKTHVLYISLRQETSLEHDRLEYERHEYTLAGRPHKKLELIQNS